MQPGINFFVAGAALYTHEEKNRKTHWYEAVSSALNFPFLKEVSQNSSFLMLSTSKNEEVSKNCFVFDVVNFENCGRLAESSRF